MLIEACALLPFIKAQLAQATQEAQAQHHRAATMEAEVKAAQAAAQK